MKIFKVDSFTKEAFSGNPAGVCILSEPREDLWMQRVAREMNLPETAFLEKKDNGYNLRWFTPVAEVDLCGHATLAGAHVLKENGSIDTHEGVRFFTKSGILAARFKDEWIELDFPQEPEDETAAPMDLIKALGVNPLYVGKNRFDYLVEVESEEIVRNCRPDFSLLASVPARGAIITSCSNSKDYDFVSRFFAPAIGVNEDPVTGSTHCCLGMFWRKKLNRNEFTAYQASERGGMMKVEVKEGRVFLSGQAVTVLKGELLV